MAIVKFQFSKERDINNIWETCNSGKSFGKDFSADVDQKIKTEISKKNFKEAKEFLEKINEKIYSSHILKSLADCLNESWNTIEKIYIERLEKITKRKICSNSINGYITTISRCPYNPNESYFMVYCFENIFNAMRTAGHEIFHLQFHKYFFDKVEKEVGKEKTHYIKEALTVLLNIEFLDLWFSKDRGYELHKELRKFIEKEWKQEKEFDKLIDKCIDFVK